MKLIPPVVTNKLGRPLLHLQKASPRIMFVSGVVGIIGTTVLACRATLRVSDVLTESEQKLEHAKALHERDAEYDEKTYTKDVTVLRVKTGVNVAKLYLPAVGLGVVSVGLLTGSHVALSRRNASLTAGYAAVDKAFREYRDRVKEQLGDDEDRKFRYGFEKIEETVQGKDGKEKTITHERVAPGQPSMYARFFDELCSPWVGVPEHNRIFLQGQQGFFNNMLQSRGHVFLNEIYDALGMERSGAGAMVGWVVGKGGDDYIDFGIFDDVNNPQVRNFVNGREGAILLDFNVDGPIFDKI